MDPWDEEHLAGRPACPYVPGFTMRACQHTPPDPFGGSCYTLRPAPYYSQPFDVPRDSELKNMTRMEIVMNSPPLEKCSSHPFPDKASDLQRAATHRIKITKVLYGGDLHGAQIVLCNVQVLADNHSFAAVAKIYDPLYYRHFPVDVDGQEDEDGVILDTPEAADGDYSREAAAYEQLQTRNMHGYTPTYYGSYTFTLQTQTGGDARHVRFILIEYLEGLCLAHLPVIYGDAQNEGYRMSVFARLKEGQARVRHARVINADDHPRNWIILPAPPLHLHESRKPDAPQANNKEKSILTALAPQRVVMLDFGSSGVWSRSEDHYLRQLNAEPKTALPINPLLRQWRSPSAGEHMDWVPEWYFDDDMRRQQWLVKEFYEGGEAEKYESFAGVPQPGKLLPQA